MSTPANSIITVNLSDKSLGALVCQDLKSFTSSAEVRCHLNQILDLLSQA